MFNWEQSTYTLVIGFFSVIVLFVPFTGRTYDGRRKWHRKITIKGWIALLAFGASITASVFKDKEAKKHEETQSQNDSITRVKETRYYQRLNQQNNLSIIKTMASELARTDLHYLETEKRFERLVKDSVKTKIQIFSLDPEVNVCDVSQSFIKADTLMLNISMCASNKKAFKVSIKFYTIFEINNQLIYSSVKQPNFVSNLDIAAGTVQTTRIAFENFHKVSYIYLLFKGEYYNESHKKFSFEQINTYNATRQEFGKPILAGLEEKIISLFRKNGINYRN